jgi:hypothetical protein
MVFFSVEHEKTNKPASKIMLYFSVFVFKIEKCNSMSKKIKLCFKKYIASSKIISKYNFAIIPKIHKKLYLPDPEKYLFTIVYISIIFSFAV